MLARILFAPIGLLIGLVVARRVGGNSVNKAWAEARGTLPPSSTTEQATWPEVIGAAVLKGSVVAVVATVSTRLAARGFRYLFGYWPGEKSPTPAPQLRQRPE